MRDTDMRLGLNGRQENSSYATNMIIWKLFEAFSSSESTGLADD